MRSQVIRDPVTGQTYLDDGYGNISYQDPNAFAPTLPEQVAPVDAFLPPEAVPQAQPQAVAAPPEPVAPMAPTPQVAQPVAAQPAQEEPVDPRAAELAQLEANISKDPGLSQRFDMVKNDDVTIDKNLTAEDNAKILQRQQMIDRATELKRDLVEVPQIEKDRQAFAEKQDREREFEAKAFDDVQKRAKLAHADYDRFEVDHSLSSGTKAQFLFSAILSGIGNIVSGRGETKIPALDMMQAEIARNVNEQLMKRAKLKERDGEARSGVASFEKFSKDSEAQRLMLTSQMQKSWAARLENVGQKYYADANAQQNYMLAATKLREDAQKNIAAAIEKGAEFDFKAAKQEFDIAKQKQDNEMQRKELGFKYYNAKLDNNQKTAALEESRLKRISDAKIAEEAAIRSGNKEAREAALFDRQMAEREISGFEGLDGKPTFARSDSESKEIREQIAAGKAVVSYIQQLKAIRADHDGPLSKLPGEKKALVEATTTALQDALRLAGKMGALDNGTSNATKGMMGGAQVGWEAMLNGTISLDALGNNTAFKINKTIEGQRGDDKFKKFEYTDNVGAPAREKTENEKLAAAALRAKKPSVPEALIPMLAEKADRLEKKGTISALEEADSIRQKIATFDAAAVENLIQAASSPEQAAALVPELQRQYGEITDPKHKKAMADGFRRAASRKDAPPVYLNFYKNFAEKERAAIRGDK